MIIIVIMIMITIMIMIIVIIIKIMIIVIITITADRRTKPALNGMVSRAFLLATLLGPPPKTNEVDEHGR